MEIEFGDDEIALICTDRAHKLGLPIGVIKSARRKLVLLHDAPDERTLRNWKSLNYKMLKGDKKRRRSIRLNDQYRMVISVDGKKQPPVVTVLEIGDTHE